MIYLIIAISTIVFTIWTLFCGSIQIRCNDRDFNIEAKGWNDYTGEYSQIDSISYEVNVLQNDNDYRTNGFGNLKYDMGNFKNDIFGDYMIIPGISEPPARTLRATFPENERHIFR